MNKFIKILITIAASAAFLYAGSSDSAAISDQENKIVLPAPTATMVTPADKIAKTGTTPKTPTSWSKIKDLFL